MATCGEKTSADISALLRARNPLILCATREEARAERIVIDGGALAGYAPVFWDCASGITRFDGSAIDASAIDPAAVIAAIRDSKQRQVWILRDMSAWFRDPTVTRALRNLCRTLPQSPRDSARAVVLLSPSAELPPELSAHAIVVDVPLPDRTEIGALLDAAIAALPEELRATCAPNGTRDAAIDSAVGLSAEEIQSTFARSIIATRTIDAVAVASEKKRVIARERVLEWFDPLPAGLDGVGGLENLKAWLMQRKLAFGPKAKAYGLPAPRGVLIVGAPGCGKSLTAKAISTAWGLPLLRADAGALQSKWVGESQQNIRKALRTVDTVAPAVLWFDEIEKALAGATQGAADGGVSQDALGTILTWMQESTAPVFVVATANDASVLPGALLRRFDAIFYVDLPTTIERAEILRAALASYGRTEEIDCDAVANASAEFTGSEMAALVKSSMYAAFADGARPITTDDVLFAAKATVPLARTSAESITGIRKWSNGRAIPASAQQAVATAVNSRSLDI